MERLRLRRAVAGLATGGGIVGRMQSNAFHLRLAHVHPDRNRGGRLDRGLGRRESIHRASDGVLDGCGIDGCLLVALARALT